MCLLYSLLSQTNKDWEAIVMDEGENEEIIKSLNDSRIKYYRHDRMEITDGRGSLGLLAKDAGRKYATGKYLCFPSEDIYYVPKFIEYMLAEVKYFDLLYCNFVHEYFGYKVIDAAPVVKKMDTCNFIMLNHDKFKDITFESCFDYEDKESIGLADGLFVEKLLVAGATNEKVDAVLMVHN